MARSRRRRSRRRSRRLVTRGVPGLIILIIAAMYGWSHFAPASFSRHVREPLASRAGSVEFADSPSDATGGYYFYGMPAGAPAANHMVEREIYALSSNPVTKFADWVAYRVDLATMGDGSESTSREWQPDPALDAAETLEPDDYRGAHEALHTDRGHQAPLASFRGTGHWQETNYLSNITPQSSDLNQGSWVALENRERDLARTSGRAVYVMTGPLYEREMDPLPGADEPHRVPSGYWKIVCQGGPDCAGFVFDQETPRNDPVLAHLDTIDDIERRTGLDFLLDFPDADESKLESQTNRAWAEKWAE